MLFDILLVENPACWRMIVAIERVVKCFANLNVLSSFVFEVFSKLSATKGN